MGLTEECGCFKKKSKRWLSTLLICMILFAKLYEAKGVPVRKNTVQSGTEIHKPRQNRLRRNYFRNQLIEYYRRVPSEKKKRRKRQPTGLLDITEITNKRIVLLQSKTGFFLEILPNGNVGGNINRTRFTKMELQVITPVLKRIRGVASGKYLGINRKGKVISKDDPDPETYFLEEFSENYDYLFCSVRYPTYYTKLPWYIAIKRKKGKRGIFGKTKRASRTFEGEYATRFSILNG